jgi:methyl-accepting chemotaxis protein
MSLGNLTIRTKLLILSGVGAIGVAVVFALALVEERRILMEDRQAKTRHLVETAHTLIGHYDALAKSGKLPEAEARKSAAEAVRAMRYDSKEYFWVHDLNHVVVMHPTKPEMEGTNKADLKDPNGVYLYQEMNKLVKREGQGFVAYHWPKAGTTEAIPKLSFVKLYEPWGWVVGSGIYIDDIDAIFAQSVKRLGIVMAIGALLAGLVTLWILRGVSRPLNALRTFGTTMQDIARDGDLSRRIPVSGADEIADVMKSFNGLMDSFQRSLGNVQATLSDVTATSERMLGRMATIKDASARQSDGAAAAASSVEQLTANITRVSENTREAESVLAEAGELAATGETSIQAVTAGMQTIADQVNESAGIIETLGQRSQEITGIVSVIKDIADQTNLLALNAAIEAARAGEQGRGFAVVADEVRKLAERSATATTEISGVIGAIQRDTDRAVEAMRSGSSNAQQGVAQVQSAAASMGKISSSTRRILGLTSDIGAAIREQTSAGREMANQAEEIAREARVNSESSAATHQEAEALARSARQLAGSIAQFRT